MKKLTTRASAGNSKPPLWMTNRPSALPISCQKKQRGHECHRNEAQLKVTFGKPAFAHVLLGGDRMASVQASPSVRGKTARFHSNQSVKSPSAALSQTERLKLSVAYQKLTARDWILFLFNINVLSVPFSEFFIPTCSPAALGGLNYTKTRLKCKCNI